MFSLDFYEELPEMECVICAETKTDTHFPSSSITQKCKHLPNTCLLCIQASIKSELKCKVWKEIGCPECAAVLEYDDVQRFSDCETREKYEELMLRYAVQQDADFIWCSSGCGSGQLHDGGTDQPIVKCNSCGHLSCFQHKVSWHKGLTCEDYDELNATPEERAAQAKRAYKENAARHNVENKASEEKMDETTKRCPECKSRIEKNGGCSHMTCSRCFYQFCWECLANYKIIVETDNSAHNKECKFHTSNLMLEELVVGHEE